MEAAAHGHSTLGIPESVGKEFVKADDAPVPTDHDIAKGMRDGSVSSPQKIGDFHLFDLRITGTGAAYRSAHDEYAFRDPAIWLDDEFVERCNGLSVVFDHPDSQTLNTEEFRERAIGTIILPYVKGDEVWGIAKIFDADAAELMQTTHTSTSPGVMAGQGSQTVQTDGGTDVLVESAPAILDHLAVCQAGVWDKGGPATGIRLDADDLAAAERSAREDETMGPAEAASRKDEDMADEKEARKDGEPDFAMLMDSLSKLSDRMDAMDKARADADEKAGEEAAKAAEERAAMDKKADAKKDADEDKAGDEKAKKDAAACDEDADKKDAKKDSVHMENLEKQVAALQAQLSGVTRERTFEDREAISAAYRRADGIYQMHGTHTPEAIAGETPIAYRKRLAHGLRRHSNLYENYKLDSVPDEQTFALIEEKIYADADRSARSPENMPAGRLIPHVTTSNGHQVTKFYGDTAAAWGFFQPPLRLVGGPRIEQKGK